MAKKRASSWVHELFESSPFNVRGPKTANVKIFDITSSLCRTLAGLSEGDGFEQAKLFEDEISENYYKGSICNSLLIPNTSNQSSNLPPRVPVTPRIAHVTGFTRNDGKGWRPGESIRGLIIRGSKDLNEAQRVWGCLAEKMNTGKNEGHSIWSDAIDFFVGEVDLCEKLEPLGSTATPCPVFEGFVSRPARAFVKYLTYVLELENKLTRYQWITVFDSYLRIALASDLLWVAAMNKHLLGVFDEFKEDPELYSGDNLDQLLFKTVQFDPIEIGSEAAASLKRYTRHYIRGHLHLNQILKLLYSDGATRQHIDLNTVGGVKSLFTAIRAFGVEELFARVRREVVKIHNEEPELMLCTKTGPFSEPFFTSIYYALRQHDTRDRTESHFDQGYWAKKDRKNAPWKFWPGPVALVLFTHLASIEGAGDSTAGGFSDLLGQFGIKIDIKEINSGRVGKDLRNLGLVVDSPDAEGGMLINDPFGGRHG